MTRPPRPSTIAVVLDRVDASARTTLELFSRSVVRPLGLRAETPKPRAISPIAITTSWAAGGMTNKLSVETHELSDSTMTSTPDANIIGTPTRPQIENPRGTSWDR